MSDPRAAAARAPLVPVVLLTILWGTNWPLFAIAVHEVSVWTFRAVSVSVAGLVLLGWCAWRGEDLRIPRRYWPTVALASALYLGIWNIASTYAAVLIPSGQAALLGFTMPLWTVLGSRLLFGERLDARSLAAVALGGLGVTLLLVKGWGAYASAPAGFALGLLAGMGWAAGTLVLKRSPVPVDSVVLTGWQLVVTGVPFSLLAFALGTHAWFVPDWQTMLAIGYITLVPMAIGNAAWFTIVKRVPANVAALSAVLVPVVAMISGALVRHEPMGWYELLAMACCVGALGLNLRR